MNSKRISMSWVVVYILALAMVSSGLHAASYVWAGDTPSFRIYVGVVPAELVQHQPKLLDEGKRLHNVTPGEEKDMSHMLVWLYRKPGNERVLDVTLIAEVGLVSGDKTIKPLEKMKLGTGVSYGNFFKVHQDAEHTVSLKIYSMNSSGYEEAIFKHKGY